MSRRAKEHWFDVGEDGCWSCNLASSRDGYCQKWDGTKLVPAHRFSYENKFGKIPLGMEIDHLCKNVKCVNPEHLEVVTKLENIRRSSVAKLDIRRANEIRSRYSSGEKQTALAGIYGVGQDQISRIINNKMWQIA